MSARDDYPTLADLAANFLRFRASMYRESGEALDEIDRLRSQLAAVWDSKAQPFGRHPVKATPDQ